MKILKKCKDGGPESTVDAYVLLECKSLFSVILLRFDKGSRENYHSHAFNALTWFIKGEMYEDRVVPYKHIKTKYKRSWLPKVTKRDNLHKVFAKEVSWCFTLRGPWSKTWIEYNEKSNKEITLTNGRQILETKEKGA